jgi:hypothetical protein
VYREDNYSDSTYRFVNNCKYEVNGVLKAAENAAQFVMIANQEGGLLQKRRVGWTDQQCIFAEWRLTGCVLVGWRI